MNHGWEKKRLGDVCDVIGGSTPKTEVKEFWNGNLNWFTPAEIADAKYYSSSDRKITTEAVKASGLTLMPPGTVLLTSRAPIGKVGITTEYSYCNQGFKNLICRENLYNEYLYHTLIYFNEEIKAKGRGVTFKEISKKATESISIPVPPLAIQKRIASELDRINELIEIKRSQLADLDALAQSLFYEIFGDPLENSKKWNVGTLSEYANFKNGLNFTPADDGNKIKCLGVGDFKSNRYIKAENLPEINIVEAVSEEYLLKDGDIILVRSNGNKALIGRSIMYVSDNSLATFSGFCIRCRYNREKLAPLFLSYYLSCGAIREYITSHGRGCNISNLNQKILSGIPLILPPLSLQNEFAKKIEVIEEQKRLIESSIADLETLLASRMDYWYNDI